MKTYLAQGVFYGGSLLHDHSFPQVGPFCRTITSLTRYVPAVYSGQRDYMAKLRRKLNAVKAGKDVKLTLTGRDEGTNNMT